MNVIWHPSPNWNRRDRRYPLQGDVSHRIVGSAPSALSKFSRAGTASSHFVIGHTQTGDPCPECGPITGARGALVVWQCVDLSLMAWTNGDVRSPTWPRYQPGVNPNLTTITTEHEDMGAGGRHIVTDHVWRTSVELKRLLHSGDLGAVRAAGIKVGDGAFTAAELVGRMAQLPIDATVYIDHHQIAGPNKPWCWRDYDGDRGFPSRLPGLLAALEDTMPTPPLHYVPQLWRAKAGGAQLREQADPTAPVVATVPEGGLMFSVGEDQSAGIRWRLVVAGDPERLFYAQRGQIDPLPPTPRDQALYDGIAAVVNARAAGQPVPTGTDPALIEEARRAGFDAGFSDAKAKGVAAVGAVQP